MSKNFSLKLSNSTFNDITDVEVVWESKKLGVSNFECVRARSSKEYTLIEGWSTLTKVAIVASGALPMFSLPLVIWGRYTTYKLEVTITFRNDRKDKIDIYLDRTRNSFQKSEHVLRTHKVNVQGKQDDQTITIVFENTDNQVKNHQAEQLKEVGMRLVSEGKFEEGIEKFNEACQKANEEITKKSIEICLNNVEHEMNNKASMMHVEGKEMLKDDNYDRALEKFKDALRFARKNEMIVEVKKMIDTAEKKKNKQENCEKIIMEAERLLNNYQYQAALKKFAEAQNLMQKAITVTLITNKLNEVQKIISEEKCNELNLQAQVLLKSHKYDETLKILRNALNFANTARRLTLVTNDITKIETMKRNQEECERLTQEAETLMNKDHYEEALKKFAQALGLTQKTETINFITKKQNEAQKIIESEEKCRQLNQQAQVLLKSHRYDEALEILDKALNFAKATSTDTLVKNNITKVETMKRNQGECERLAQEAETLMNNDQYEEALKKFAQALGLTQKTETINFITKKQDQAQKIIESEEKCRQLNQQAQVLLKSHRYDEALEILDKALNFAKATSTDTLVKNNITKIETMKRNQEECERLAQEAETLMNNDQYEEALKKFAQALGLTQKTETINFITKKHNEAQKIIESEEKCRQLNQQAQVLLKGHRYDEALEILNKALNFAKITSTVTLVKNDITKVETMKRNQEECEKLIQEAETLMNNDQYEEALKKFTEALGLTQKTESIDFIKKKQDQAQKIIESEEKCRELNQQAQVLLKGHRYDQALKILNKALNFAKATSTVTLVKNDIAKIETLKRTQEECERLTQEAETLMNNDHYEEALKKFTEALGLTQKPKTINSITKKQHQVQKIIESEEKCHKLNQQAQILLKSHKYDQVLNIFRKALNFAKKTRTFTSVKKNITRVETMKRKQEKSERLNQQAEILMSNHQYEEALKKFGEARSLAQKTETIDFITKKQDEVLKIIESEEKCRELNRQAQALLKKDKYDEALKILRNALNFATTTRRLALIENDITKVETIKKNQERSEKLNQEAGTLMKIHQYGEALKKLEQALRVTKKGQTRRLIIRNIARAQDAKKNCDKAAILYQKGEKLLSEAFLIEGSSQDKSREVTRKFNAARSLFTRARKLRPDEAYEKNRKLVNAKIQGNKCYNVGIRLENEAMELKDTMKSVSDRKAVLDKCEKAENYYKRALKHFEEGMKIDGEKFQRSVELAKDAEYGVREISNMLRKNNLNYAIGCTVIKTADSMVSRIEEDSEIAERNCYFRTI